MPRLRVEIITVTPDMAAAMLSRPYEKNRPIDRGEVVKLVGALRRGEWQPVHQGVAISPDGKLLDGQHRLTAIVESGIAACMAVAFEVPESAFAVMDRGKVRPLSTALGITNTEVAVTRLALSVIDDRRGSPSIYTGAQVAGELPVFQPVLQRMRQATPTIRKTRTSAGVLLGVIACMVTAPEERDRLAEQYRAFVLLDYIAMMPPVLGLSRQIDEGRATASKPHDLLVRAWIGFGRTPQQPARILVKDLIAQLSPIRTTLLTLSRAWHEARPAPEHYWQFVEELRAPARRHVSLPRRGRRLEEERPAEDIPLAEPMPLAANGWAG